MPVKTPVTPEEQNRAYNPGEQLAQEQFGSPYASAGIDQLEKHANDPGNSSSTDTANDMEKSNVGFENKVTGNNQPRRRFFRKISVKNLKKAGPLGVIGLISGFGLFGIGFLTPGLAVIQIKEMLTDDLNDQLAAMDIRSTAVMKAKLNDIGKGICTGVQIKCKFKGMSDRQIRKFDRAGITVNAGDNKNVLGRKNVTSITFSNGRTASNPAQVRDMLNDPTVRTEMRRAFNPKFAGLYDKVSASVLKRYNTSKASKVTGNTPEERDASIEKSAKEGSGSVDTARASGVTADGPDDNKTYNSDNGPVSEQDGNDAKAKSNEINNNISAKSVGGSAFGGAVRGVQITGALDTLCTVKNTAKAVTAASKLIRKRQLIGFAMAFLTFADEVKAGTATPEQAEHMGNKLAAVDTVEMTASEDSTFVSEDEPSLEPNPYFGKNAFDSEGYRASAYNDAPNLTARAGQFTIGGALSGSMATKLADVGYGTPGDTTCKVIQNPLVRLGSAAVGIVAGGFSMGATTAITVGSSVAISLALPLLEAYLADMIAGEVVGGDTKGVDAGNAIFAGTAGLLGDVAMGRGMTPSSSEEIQEYASLSKSIENEYIAMETEDARSTPFDIYNQYSFLGSISRTILPAATQAQSSIPALPAASLQLIGAAGNSIFPVSNAAEEWNPERFSKCDDEQYAKLGIDADIFCNVRYSLTSEELAMDTDAVVDWMLANNHITENGTSKGDKYPDWLRECTQRTQGWGESEEGNNKEIGRRCINGDNGKSLDGELTATELSNFRIFTIDNSISEAMEYEGEQSGSGSGGATTGVTFDNIAFPLGGGKSAVKNPDIFKNGTTNTGGHPNTAYDIYAAAGTEVRAFADGVVSKVHSGGMGGGISIYNQAAGLHVYYTHMQVNSSITVGATITAGQALGSLVSVNDYPSINTDHLHIDASPGQVRQACSRNNCPNKDVYVDLGPDLFKLWEALP